MRNYSVSKDYHIYTLSDPETLHVRYVGCTMNPKSRLSAHLVELSSKAKAKWISELKVKGLLPIMRTVHIANNLEEAIRMEKEVYNRYDSNLLTCVNPAKHSYSNNGASPRLTMRNRKHVAKYFIENCFKLLDLNGLTIRQFARLSNLTEGRITALLSGEYDLLPEDAHSLTRDFSSDQSRMILPNQTFRFDDSLHKYITNRVSKYKYQRTKYKYKPLVKLTNL